MMTKTRIEKLVPDTLRTYGAVSGYRVYLRWRYVGEVLNFVRGGRWSSLVNTPDGLRLLEPTRGTRREAVVHLVAEVTANRTKSARLTTDEGKH